MIVADLRHSRLAGREGRLCHIVQPVRVKSPGEDVLLLSDDHLVRIGTDLRHHHPAAHGKAKASALSDGIMDDSLMAPENRAVLRHKITLHRRLPCGPLDKARVILIRHKADLLAVRLVRHPKLQTGREFPDLFLCIGPHRHQRVGKLFLGQIVEGVGLVLGLRHAAAHGEAAVCQPGHPGVVPCGDIVRANLQAALKKRLPFHIAVAGDAGVRRAPCQIFRRKIVNN